MSWFEYTAVTPSGEKVGGRLEADSAEALRWSLVERGLKPSTVRETETGESTGSSSGNNLGSRSIHIELTLRQLAVMLRSGLTLLASIETVIEQPPSRATRRVFCSIRDSLESGDSFASALAKHRCFPVGVVAMIGMGEESGNLDTVIERAALSMELKRRNLSSTLTALFYPVLVLLLAIAICIYMALEVIPPMKKALLALGRPLPAVTQSLIEVTDFFAKWGVLIGAVGVIFIIVFVMVWLWPPGRLAIDRFMLRLPLIGTILRTGATSLFARSMSTLLGSGIPLVEGLRIVSTIHGNRYLSAVVESARRRILEGSSLAESLGSPHAYKPMMIKMIGVGEASGNLEETLHHIADFHEERLQTLIKQLATFLEPVVILLVGLLVGYVYFAFFLALYGGV
ncbi:MAG: type II secretion system F family protein [Verrucomicrobiota bacterium]